MAAQAHDTEHALRVVPLDPNRRLVLRSTTVEDAEALGELYDGLTPEDRRRRFFCGFRPTDHFIRNWVTIGERGGCGLIAVVESDTEPPQLVGEAGCVPLSNGNAEFAITVAEGWRGWLGPYLLDVLIDEAADKGIENLEAEILLENRAMLALARHRGEAVAPHDDPTSVHTVISTTGTTPGWPPVRSRPQVLLETPGVWWPRRPTLALLATTCSPAPDRIGAQEATARRLPGDHVPSPKVSTPSLSTFPAPMHVPASSTTPIHACTRTLWSGSKKRMGECTVRADSRSVPGPGESCSRTLART